MTPPDDLIRRKEELEDFLDRYGRTSRIFGVLVVVGLTIEFAAIVLSFFYEALSRIVDACGLFLVTVGVGGEIRAEFDSHRAERRLRIANQGLAAIAEVKVRERDERIAELNLKTEQERLARIQIGEQLLEAIRVGSEAEKQAATAIMELEKAKTVVATIDGVPITY